MNYELDIQKEYLAEALELLEQAENVAIAMEHASNSDQHIDNLFRVVHTLKGSGFSAGFNEFACFAHKCEALLNQIRERTLTINQDVMDLILESFDFMSQWARSLQDDYRCLLANPNLENRLDKHLDDSQAQQAPNPNPENSDYHMETAGFGFFDGDDEMPTPLASKQTHTESDSSTINLAQPRVLIGPASTARILIVDDDPDVREIVRTYISDVFRVNISEASDGIEAWDHLETQPFDLILSDLKMPRMNGITLLEKLRNDNIKIPFIIISGFSERHDMIEFIRLGAFGFIEKPIYPENLIQIVQNGLRTKRTQEITDALFQLNFQNYLLTSKLVRTQPVEKRQQLEQQIKDLLDRISDLNHALFEYQLPYSA
jgi:CheY-like chemotaxis protein/HPt (histidine-containing phosphotransfer) domain-containing protein